jgi:hypothetical protein
VSAGTFTGGGGGGGEIPSNFTITPEVYNILTYPNRNFTRSLRVCNKDTKTIKLQFSPTGEYNYWVTAITYKGEGFLFQAVPAYGLPGKIDFLMLDAGICDDIDVQISVPEVPDGTYEIGIKAIDVSTSSTQMSKMVITTRHGIGLIREYYEAFIRKIMFGIRIGPDIEKVGICSISGVDLCIPGKTSVYIPAIIGLGSMIAVGYAVWHFTRKRYPKISWLFVLITIILMLFIIP